jgi:hypothetical protein
MATIAAQSTELIRSGGFSIEISPASLRVTADKTAISPRKGSVVRTTVKVLYCIFIALFVVMIIVDLENHHKPAMFLPFAVILGLSCLSFLFGAFQGKNDIFCTEDELKVIRKIRGKVTGQWTFPKHLVGPIQFTVFSSSRSSSVYGLLFSVEGKKVRVLAGLEIVEAARILAELDRLGYTAVRDVGMPMAVEMAIERRNSIFR